MIFAFNTFLFGLALGFASCAALTYWLVKRYIPKVAKENPAVRQLIDNELERLGICNHDD